MGKPAPATHAQATPRNATRGERSGKNEPTAGKNSASARPPGGRVLRPSCGRPVPARPSQGGILFRAAQTRACPARFSLDIHREVGERGDLPLRATPGRALGAPAVRRRARRGGSMGRVVNRRWRFRLPERVKRRSCVGCGLCESECQVHGRRVHGVCYRNGMAVPMDRRVVQD